MPRPEKTLPIYLNTLAEFNKRITYKDGQQVFVKNGANWDVYQTRRTDSRKRYAVELISTGVTTV